MRFTESQLDALSELFLYLAKGSFLAALAVPAFAPTVTLSLTLKNLVAGLVFAYGGLKILERKEER